MKGSKVFFTVIFMLILASCSYDDDLLVKTLAHVKSKIMENFPYKNVGAQLDEIMTKEDGKVIGNKNVLRVELVEKGQDNFPPETDMKKVAYIAYYNYQYKIPLDFVGVNLKHTYGIYSKTKQYCFPVIDFQPSK